MNVYICPKCGNALLAYVRDPDGDEDYLECLWPLCGYRVREVDLDDAYAAIDEAEYDERYFDGEEEF